LGAVVNIASWEITTNDDPYLRLGLSIYCCGCTKNCPSCQNPELQDFNSGTAMTTSEILDIILERKELIESVIFLGGDWVNYEHELWKVCSYIKQATKLRTVLYTGEKIHKINPILLSYLDIVIDGKYQCHNRSPFNVPASNNQHVYVDGYNVEPETLPVNQELH